MVVSPLPLECRHWNVLSNYYRYHLCWRIEMLVTPLSTLINCFGWIKMQRSEYSELQVELVEIMLVLWHWKNSSLGV